MSKEQELNEWLAEEIMEWKKKEFPDIRHGDIELRGYYESWATENGYEKCGINGWNPLENLEQAFEVLEEYCDWWRIIPYNSNINNNKYICTISIPEYPNIKLNDFITKYYHNFGKTKTKVIIGAICKAEGIYEEFEEVFNNDQT